jgi:hypothetical protein
MALLGRSDFHAGVKSQRLLGLSLKVYWGCGVGRMTHRPDQPPLVRATLTLRFYGGLLGRRGLRRLTRAAWLTAAGGSCTRALVVPSAWIDGPITQLAEGQICSWSGWCSWWCIRACLSWCSWCCWVGAMARANKGNSSWYRRVSTT